VLVDFITPIIVLVLMLRPCWACFHLIEKVEVMTDGSLEETNTSLLKSF
jgi:hypothetical protein